MVLKYRVRAGLKQLLHFSAVSSVCCVPEGDLWDHPFH